MRTLLAAITIVTITLASGVAHAQRSPGPVRPPAAPAEPDVPVPDGPYDPALALGLSAGFTALSIGTFAYGWERDSMPLMTSGVVAFVITPSIGHWYVDHWGTTGLGIRVFGGAGSILAGFAVASACDRGDDCLLYMTAGVGGAVAAQVIGAIVDVATAPGDARRRNRDLARANAKKQRRVGVAPMITRETTGLALAGSF